MSQQEENMPKEGKKPILMEPIEGSAVLGIRVSLTHYNFYRKHLTGSEQERIREILRSTFEKLVEDREILSSNQSKEINVTAPVKVNVIEKAEADILKVKKMIDKYEKELAKCTEERLAFKEENDSLKQENESLKKKIEELESQLKQLSQAQAQAQPTQEQVQDKKLERLLEWLITAYYCIENMNTCKADSVKKNIMTLLGDFKLDNAVYERVKMRFKNLYTITP